MPKKILLADDSITIQKVVELTFSDGDFEVTAVNNGSRAIQKLSEMRPDIILSDIIMPEKNGYEVCEYVKSHPDFRSIPVILLTGTFEPFDPDRAEKAGCDAVVTKPFESQSLIHKVEELIAQSQPAAATPPPVEAAPVASPWLDEPTPDESPVEAQTQEQRLPGGTDDYANAENLFDTPAAEPPAPASWETPAQPSWDAPAAPSWDAPAPTPFDSGEPAADSFRSEEPLSFAETPVTPVESAAPSPWDEPADSAFAAPSFDSFGQSSSTPEPEAEESPFGEDVPAEEFSSQTRAFPKMTFDDLPHPAESASSFAETPVAEPPDVEPEPPLSPASSPWDEPAEAPAFATTAFPKVNFDDFTPPPPAPEPVMPAWDAPAEAAAFGTTAFPKMSFDDFAPAAEPSPAVEEPPTEPAAAVESQPWDETPEANPWATDSDTSDFASSSGFATAAVSSLPAEETPFEPPQTPEALFDLPPREPEPLFETPESEPEALFESAASEPEPLFDAPASEPEPLFESAPQAAGLEGELQPEDLQREPTEEIEALSEPEPIYEQEPPSMAAEEPEWAAPEVPEDVPAAMSEVPEETWDQPAVAAPPPWPETPPPPPPPPPAPALRASDLNEEQIDRIARRVVEMLSDQVVRNIAWEVVPDLAEMVVKERIRQLESEA